MYPEKRCIWHLTTRANARTIFASGEISRGDRGRNVIFSYYNTAWTNRDHRHLLNDLSDENRPKSYKPSKKMVDPQDAWLDVNLSQLLMNEPQLHLATQVSGALTTPLRSISTDYITECRNRSGDPICDLVDQQDLTNIRIRCTKEQADLQSWNIVKHSLEDENRCNSCSSCWFGFC